MNYTISCGKYTATVSSVGAELVSFTDGEKEYIWTGDEKYWNGHNPNLFPVLCRVKGGKVAFSGVEYPMEKHGFVRKREFALGEITEDSITLFFTQTPETKKSYPFDFTLEITHRVFESGFTSSYRVKNDGENTLYYNLGGHTGFNLPALGANTVDGCKLIFDSLENATVWYGDENLFVRDDFVRTDVLQNTDTIDCTQQLFEGDALMVGNMASHSVRLVAPAGAVEMDFSGFPVMGFWTPPGKNAPFICLEPWHGLPSKTFETGEFSEKPYAIALTPGEEKTLEYSVRV